MIGPIISKKKNQLETGLLFFLDFLLLTHWKASVWSPGGAVHSCCTSSSTLTHFTTTVNYFTKIYLFFTTWLEDQLRKWNFPLEVQSFGNGVVVGIGKGEWGRILHSQIKYLWLSTRLTWIFLSILLMSLRI